MVDRMRSSSLPPLFERKARSNKLQRSGDLTILFLLVTLLLHRVGSMVTHPDSFSTVHLVALLCETWFLFYWGILTNCKWKPYETKAFPERLRSTDDKLPSVDVFVTTADPHLEPPAVTANTVLSVLAMEYPADKVACYVSDDGGSALTYWALVEAARFAQRWVPFCRKHNVRVRAPAVCFGSEKIPQAELRGGASDEFVSEWSGLKKEYGEFLQRVEDARKSNNIFLGSVEGIAEFANFQRRDHPSCVKVIWENRDKQGRPMPNGTPHLIYVSREKRPTYHHQFKAGAMNALTRVSALMTNAPFILNLDCDMFVNNPDVVKHAVCLLLGSPQQVFTGFVQVPQKFYGGLKDDPYGNQLDVITYTIGHGFDGIQGAPYSGTCCFHRRKVIYGVPPQDAVQYHQNLSYDDMERLFGSSKELLESVSQAMLEQTSSKDFRTLYSCIDLAKDIINCTYELTTNWGQKIGWPYNIITEDLPLGVRIQSMGWRSTHLSIHPPGFLGTAPKSGLASLTQYKRWTTGLLEVLVTPSISPIKATLTGNLLLRQCLAYMSVLLWAVRSIPETLYSVLPPYCLLTNSSFLPKMNEPSMAIPLSIFVCYNLFSLLEYLQCGLTFMTWWNNQRMRRIISSTAWLFGLASATLKLLGFSEAVFDITPKNQSDDSKQDGINPSNFTFDESPLYIPPVAISLVTITALPVGFFHLTKPIYDNHGVGAGELVSSAWVLLNFWPFVKGLYRKGVYGIPSSVMCKSAIVAALFLYFCFTTSVK